MKVTIKFWRSSGPGVLILIRTRFA